MQFRPQRINLDSHGVGKVLGDGEADIMRVLWKLPGQSVNDVRSAMRDLGRPLSFNATMTMLNRLVEKGIARKHQGKDEQGRQVFVYHATADRKKFLQRVSSEIFRRCLADPDLFSAAGFADAWSSLSAKERKQIRTLLK